MDNLYLFQWEGVQWLQERRTAYLADEQGLGKSVEAIKAADALGIPFIAIICPKIAVQDWLRKFEQWSTFGRQVLCAFAAAPIAPAAVVEKSVIIQSYETAITHRKLLRANPHRGLLIVDEAQYVKNPEAKRTRGLYGKNCAGFGAISQPFDRVWLLSGTPCPNGDPRELWPHLRALRPYSIIDPSTDKPMTYGAWKRRFCVMPAFTNKTIDIADPNGLKRVLGDFMLRRTADIIDLPELRWVTYPVQPAVVPTELALSEWPHLADALMGILDDAEGEGTLDFELQQQLATVRRLTGLLKVELTTELVGEELRSGTLDKVVIFAYHVEVVEQIAKRLAHFGATMIHGGISEAQRWKNIDRFQTGDSRVLVGQILAAGVATTLTAARNVVFVETDWVPGNNDQAAKRCRRIGTKFPVLARIIMIPGTIDEPIQGTVSRKLRQIATIHS